MRTRPTMALCWMTASARRRAWSEPVGKKIERNIAAVSRHQDEPEHHQPDHHEHQHFVGAGKHDPEQVAANGVDHVERHHDQQHDAEQRPRHRHGDAGDPWSRRPRQRRLDVDAHALPSAGFMPPIAAMKPKLSEGGGIGAP